MLKQGVRFDLKISLYLFPGKITVSHCYHLHFRRRKQNTFPS